MPATSADNNSTFFHKPADDANSLGTKFNNDFSYVLNIPFDRKKQRVLATNINMQRLSTRFTLLTLNQLLTLASQNHMLDNVQWLLGRPLNLAILNAPIGVYNALSVGIFATRFLINMTDILQDTFTLEKGEDKLSFDASFKKKSDRFFEGLKKHHYQLANDVVWGIVNALCNYSSYFRIPSPVTNYLMLGFTVFDLSLLNLELFLENQHYKSEKELLMNANRLEIFDQAYNEKKATLIDPQQLKDLDEYYEVRNKQLNNPLRLEDLDLKHEKDRSELLFYIAGASLMLASFTVGFLFLPPAYLAGCFMMCNISFAMYLSGDKFGEWKMTHLKLTQDLAKKVDRTSSEKKVQEAWDDLGFTLAKNAIAPFIIIGAFTVSSPAAVLLTAAYMAYECGYLTRLPELVMPRP